jgi:hypothetical protein
MSVQITQPWDWSPAKLSGCSAWFDAQDSNTIVLDGPSNVSQWLDKSGQGNNATGGTSPTYNTASREYGVVFNGTTQYLSTAYTANPFAESFFAVTTWTGANNFASYEIIGASANNGRQYAVRDDGTSNVVRWEIGGSTAGYGPTAGVVVGTQFLTTGTYRPVAGGSTSLNGSNQSTRGTVSYSGSATTNIGVGYFTGLSNYYQGTINEIIIYSREVTTDERQQVEGYLAYKWNLQSNLPSSHPYKINPPFQNTLLLPTIPPGPILLAKATPSAEYSGVTNKITANVFTPLSLSNYGPPCLYWYDAQDSNTVIRDQTNYVIGWNDKSGNGYNLLSNPSITGNLTNESDSNNFKYITGAGVLSYLNTVNCEVMSCFIMYSDQFPDAGTEKYVFGAIPTGGGDNSEDSLGGFIFESLNGAAGPNEVRFFSGDRASYTTNTYTPVDAGLYLTLFEFDVDQTEGDRPTDPSTITQTSWVNGYSSNGATFPATSTPRLSTNGGLSLGGFYGVTSNVTQIGGVYEIIGVSGPITEVARQKVVSYYAWKYSQKPNVPQDNPYLVIPARGTSY